MPHVSFSRRVVLGSIVGAVAGLAAPRARGERDAVVLGQVSLSFYAVVGAVVQYVLERLGHTVQVREGPHEAVFPLLSEGAVDLMVAAWLPEGHAQYWERYGRQAREVARLYEGARFFWAVPDYVPTGSVSTIADLASPQVLERMTRDIQAIGPGATITAASTTALERYGLADRYRVLPGTSALWLDTYRRLHARGEWFVFPTWTPQYLNNAGTLRELRDPLSVLGHANHAALVAPSTRFDALPVRTRDALSRVQLSLDDVNRMDWAVNVEGRSVQEAARDWLDAHPHRLARWLGAPEITID